MNLWVDKKGRSKGDRPDAMFHDAPFVKTHWYLAVLWLFGLAIKIGVVQEYQKYASVLLFHLSMWRSHGANVACPPEPLV